MGFSQRTGDHLPTLGLEYTLDQFRKPGHYDHGTPIDEAGLPTAKYHVLRAVLARHLPAGTTLPPIPEANPVIALPVIRFREAAALTGVLPKPRVEQWPLPMEALGQGQGCLLYRTKMPPGRATELVVTEARDFTVVLLDGKRVGACRVFAARRKFAGQ